MRRGQISRMAELAAVCVPSGTCSAHIAVSEN